MRNRDHVLICGRVIDHPEAAAEYDHGRRCIECHAPVLTVPASETIIKTNKHTPLVVCDHCLPPEHEALQHCVTVDADTAVKVKELASAGCDTALPPRGTIMELRVKDGPSLTVQIVNCFDVQNIPDLRSLFPNAPPPDRMKWAADGYTHFASVTIGPCLMILLKDADGWHEASSRAPVTLTPVAAHRIDPTRN